MSYKDWQVLRWLSLMLNGDVPPWESSANAAAKIASMANEYWRIDAADPVVPSAWRHRIESIIGMDSRACTWELAIELESLIVQICPDEFVRVRLRGLRKLFRELITADQYKEYTKSASDLDEKDVRVVRADAWFVLHEIYRLRMLLRRQEQRRAILTLLALFIAAIIIGYPTWVIVSTTSSSSPNTPIRAFFMVALCGSLGGLVSTIRRLQAVPVGTDYSLAWLLLMRNRWLVVLAPGIGAIMAIVFYAFMMAGFVGGDLFPKLYVPIKNILSNSLDLKELFRSTSPVNGVDYAKLFVWSFVAGFAERFVPGRIDRMVLSAEETK